MSEPMYLIDPRQRDSSSNAQEQCQPTQTQRPTSHHHPTIYTQQSNTQPRNPFMPNTQPRNLFMLHTLPQNQESNPTHQQPYTVTTTVYSSDDSYGSLHHIPPPMTTQTSHHHNTQPLFNYSTPQEPLIRFQNDSMSQFGQLYRPQFTQPQPSIAQMIHMGHFIIVPHQ